ncbi:TfuA-like protein [Streptomyces lydicus]|uniref:TfuA-like protein n=1 Tax=Streptomyces lydicus TaxID=47763 RepID=UPI0036BE4D34
MTVHAFVGPSCPTSILVKHYPDVVRHGPVGHGDLFVEEIEAGDVVVIIDGVYHHRPALRHKEILDAMAHGVTVVGAASIGALRAAELSTFGMSGVGQIYQWFRDGTFDGDDAVSVAHSESGDPTGINVPLVNLHAAMLAGCRAGVLREESSAGLLARLEQEYYPLRSTDRVLSIVEASGEPEFASWYRAQLRQDPFAFDQKLADTLAAVEFSQQVRTSPTATSIGVEFGRDWHTEYLRRWRNRFTMGSGTPMLHRLAYQQLFDSAFPQTWWEYVHRSFRSAPSGTGDGLGRFVAHALGATAVEWIDDPILRARITMLICPVPDLGEPWQTDLLLRGETADDRQVMSEWLRLAEEHLDRHPGRSLSHIPEATCRRLLARIWNVEDDLLPECGRRGFSSLPQAADALRPFAIGYLSQMTQATASGGQADG